MLLYKLNWFFPELSIKLAKMAGVIQEAYNNYSIQLEHLVITSVPNFLHLTLYVRDTAIRICQPRYIPYIFNIYLVPVWKKVSGDCFGSS